jgi:hypothetical protein
MFKEEKKENKIHQKDVVISQIPTKRIGQSYPDQKIEKTPKNTI